MGIVKTSVDTVVVSIDRFHLRTMALRESLRSGCMIRDIDLLVEKMEGDISAFSRVNGITLKWERQKRRPQNGRPFVVVSRGDSEKIERLSAEIENIVVHQVKDISTQTVADAESHLVQALTPRNV